MLIRQLITIMDGDEKQKKSSGGEAAERSSPGELQTLRNGAVGLSLATDQWNV